MDLFTHEQEYRSELLMNKIADQRILVCGCGAIGSNLIDNLVRQGFRAIDVIDMDRIEKHNLGSQIWERREAGAFKVRRMKERAYAITGKAIGAIEKRLDEDNINRYINDDMIVIDAFDNTASRKLLYDHCQGKNCLHVGLFQDFAEVIWNENYTVPQEGAGPDICEYPLARNIAMLSVIVASEVLIKYLDSGNKKNYTITLRDLQIRALDT